jgi:hypothetical protein
VNHLLPDLSATSQAVAGLHMALALLKLF